MQTSSIAAMLPAIFATVILNGAVREISHKRNKISALTELGVLIPKMFRSDIRVIFCCFKIHPKPSLPDRTIWDFDNYSQRLAN